MSLNTTGLTRHAQNSAWENQRVPTAWWVRRPKGARSQHGTHVNSISTEMDNRRVLRPEATTPPAGELLGGHPRGVHHGLASLKHTEPGRPAHHTRGTRGREFESKEANPARGPGQLTQCHAGSHDGGQRVRFLHHRKGFLQPDMAVGYRGRRGRARQNGMRAPFTMQRQRHAGTAIDRPLLRVRTGGDDKPRTAQSPPGEGPCTPTAWTLPDLNRSWTPCDRGVIVSTTLQRLHDGCCRGAIAPSKKF